MPARMRQALLAPGWYGRRVPRACIIGLGVIGGSWAGALSRRGWTVWAVETEQASLDLAIQRGWVTTGFHEVPPCLDVDLVVIALPLPAMVEGFIALQGRLIPGAIVTDVGSIKGDICARAQSLLGEEVHFIGGHPMAGSEKSGFAVADEKLFNGFPYALINCGEKTEPLERLTGLIQSFGAKVVFRDQQKHDAEVALVSHIPHLLAVGLALAAAGSDGDPASLQLAGRSFRDITRIADSSPEMWQEIMVKNREAILKGLACWQSQLDKLTAYVQRADGEGIAEAFRQAHHVRSMLE